MSLLVVAMIIALAVMAAKVQQLGEDALSTFDERGTPASSEISNELLQQIGTVAVTPPAPFAARDHFVEDISGRAGAAIAWIGDTFRRRLLDKVETRSSTAEMLIHRLRVSATNQAIFARIGDRSPIGLAHIWALLLRQPAGEDGPLVTRDGANLFLVPDMQDTVWVVDLVWGGAGWEIGATPLDDPWRWRAGHRILTH